MTYIPWKKIYDTSRTSSLPMEAYGGLSKKDLIERELYLLEQSPEGQELFNKLINKRFQESIKQARVSKKIIITANDMENSLFNPSLKTINISFEQLKNKGFVSDGNVYVMDLGSALAHESFHALGNKPFEDSYLKRHFYSTVQKNNAIEFFLIGNLNSTESKIVDKLSTLADKIVDTEATKNKIAFKAATANLLQEISATYKLYPDFIKSYLTYMHFVDREFNYQENIAMDFTNLYRRRRGIPFFRKGSYHNTYYFEDSLDRVLTSFDIQNNPEIALREQASNDVKNVYNMQDKVWSNLFGDERDALIQESINKIDELTSDCFIDCNEFSEIEALMRVLLKNGFEGHLIQKSDSVDIKINGYFLSNVTLLQP